MSTQALLSEKTLTADAAPGGSAASGIDRVPLIPIRKRQYGPLVLKRRGRSFVGWAVIFAVSWVLLATDLGSGWKALSLGLMIPGAGFLYGGSIILAALGLLAVPVAVINWFSSGNMSAVLGAWFGGAALSAWYAAGNPDPWSAVAVATPYLTLGLMAFWITYPDVLVARAFSDGNDLQLVLHPGAGGKRIRLGVDQLVPGPNYRALGAVEETVIADPFGCASLVVDLSGRHELRLLPSV